MSVVAHEVSHGYVAALLGDPTARLSGRLTLNPIKHIDRSVQSLFRRSHILELASFWLGKASALQSISITRRKWGQPLLRLLVRRPIFLLLLFRALLAFFGLVGLDHRRALYSQIVMVNLVLSVLISFQSHHSMARKFSLHFSRTIILPSRDG